VTSPSVVRVLGAMPRKTRTTPGSDAGVTAGKRPAPHQPHPCQPQAGVRIDRDTTRKPEPLSSGPASTRRAPAPPPRYLAAPPHYLVTPSADSAMPGVPLRPQPRRPSAPLRPQPRRATSPVTPVPSPGVVRVLGAVTRKTRTTPEPCYRCDRCRRGQGRLWVASCLHPLASSQPPTMISAHPAARVTGAPDAADPA